MKYDYLRQVTGVTKYSCHMLLQWLVFPRLITTCQNLQHILHILLAKRTVGKKLQCNNFSFPSCFSGSTETNYKGNLTLSKHLCGSKCYLNIFMSPLRMYFPEYFTQLHVSVHVCTQVCVRGSTKPVGMCFSALGWDLSKQKLSKKPYSFVIERKHDAPWFSFTTFRTTC